MNKRFKQRSTGAIATLVDCGVYQTNFNHYTSTMASELIEGSCDWEEIKEQTYQILSFQNINNLHAIVELHPNGLYCYKKCYCYTGVRTVTEEYCLLSASLQIYSVKDLTRDIVFTIGDTFYYDDPNLPNKSSNYKITGFKIDNNNISHDSNLIIMSNGIEIAHLPICYPTKPHMISEDGIPLYDDISTFHYIIKTSEDNWQLSYISSELTMHKGVCNPNLLFFSTIEAAKKYIKQRKSKPLFTTEDGVPIYEDNIVYMVEKDTFVISSRCNANGQSTFYYWYFSTKEKAEEYIIKHKPCLSFQEIKDQLLGNEDTSLTKKMLSYVKDKLNLND